MGQSNVSLTSALANIRSMLDEPNPQFWSNTELTLWLNEACIDIQRRSQTLRATKTIAVTALTQSYAAPNDTYLLHRIEFVPTGSNQTYTLEFRGIEGMDQYWGNLQSLPAAWPSLYTLWYSPIGASASPGGGTQMQIKLYPVPAQNGNLTVYYYRLVTNVVAGTDTLDVLPGFEDLAYDYAVYKAYRKDASPLWKDQQALYSAKLQDMIDATRNWTDQTDYFNTGPVGQPAWLTGGFDAY